MTKVKPNNCFNRIIPLSRFVQSLRSFMHKPRQALRAQNYRLSQCYKDPSGRNKSKNVKPMQEKVDFEQYQDYAYC